MRIACYADDPKEPEIIGEALVSIDDVLQKGEIDGEHPAMTIALNAPC